MDQANFNYGSVSQSLLSTPVSTLSPSGTYLHEGRAVPPRVSVADVPIQTYNEFEAAFGLAAASATYPDTPESPSHSHDSTGDESGDVNSKATVASHRRTPETRKRKPRRKPVQPAEQILKRRVQNRAAQRSFRERQKEYVHDLELQVESLKGEISKLHEGYREMLRAVTSAPRMVPPMGYLDSPASTHVEDFDDLGYGAEQGNWEVSGMEGSAMDRMAGTIKVERNLWTGDRAYSGDLFSPY
jgi:hypothetical protein